MTCTYREHRLPHPAPGALAIVFFMRRANDTAVRNFATAAAIDLLVSVPLWFAFDRGGELFQFRESHAWIPSIGVRYEFGIDGMASLPIPLTTLLGLISFVPSWSAITTWQKEYYVFLLLLQTGMSWASSWRSTSSSSTCTGSDAGADVLPDRHLGRRGKLYAAIKFFLYTLVGSVLMPPYIPALYFHQRGLFGWEGLGNEATFSILQFHEIGALIPADLQFWIFIAFFSRLRDQGADVPAPHLAAGRARRGAHRRLGDPGRRPPQDGNLRLRALLAADPAAGDARAPALDGRALDHRHRLRRPGGDGAEGHEEARPTRR